MKRSNDNSVIYKHVLIGCLFVFLCGGVSIKAADAAAPGHRNPPAGGHSQAHGSPNPIAAADHQEVASQGRRETIVDKGLNMPLGSINVPNGWRFVQDVVSNTSSDGYVKFVLYVESPQGEILGMLPPLSKYAIFQTNMSPGPSGIGFEQAVYEFTAHQIKPIVTQFVFGDVLPVTEKIESPGLDALFDKARQDVQSTNQFYLTSGTQANAEADLGLFRAEMQATRNNQSLKGLVSIVKMGRIDSTPYSYTISGSFVGSYFLASPERFEQLKASKEDFFKFQINPEWDRAKARIIDQNTQQMSQTHQANMKSRTHQFNLHQQQMRETSQMYDQQNQAWHNRTFGPNGSSSYSGNQAFIDGVITGQTTFNDPYSGFQIRKDGHYDYWFTNEFGEYKGTNDPNYDPTGLPGNWTPIKPVTPDH